LVRDEVEATGKFLAEQAACRWTVGVPPIRRLANLPLGLLDDQQTKALVPLPP
jgi:hypothetical protein